MDSTATQKDAAAVRCQ